MTLLSCRGVEASYDRVQVLFGVDLDIDAGEIVALLGTNGAGKSTLLSTISGLLPPDAGQVTFDGQDITGADPVRIAGLGIAQVPGGRAVFPTLSVAEHLRLAGWLHRDGQATTDVLDLFPRLAERTGQAAGDLSGGEQQMLGLAMAFLARPQLLMIDELSLGLAPTIIGDLLDVVRGFRDAGTAVIIVEQSVHVALGVAERAYFMEKGEIRYSGPAADLLGRDDLLRSVFLAGAADDVPGPATMVGSPPEERPGAAAASGPRLQVRDLVKRYGGIHAVDGVSLTVGAGETLGIIGPNGAGKTTVLDCISGFARPDRGQVVLNGEDLTDLPPDRRAWHGLARSFQHARLVPSLTVAENLALALERHLEHRDHFAAALNLPGVVRQEEDVAWTVADLVDLLRLEAFRDKFVRELSTGTRRIVDLAMCIAHDPSVLLLDEPSSGIAQREVEALGGLLERVRRETGCALVVIEHDIPLITAIADRLVALDLGRVIAAGAPDEVVRDPLVIEAYLGGDPADGLVAEGAE